MSAFSGDRPALLSFSNRAQAAAGLHLTAAEWLALEQVTHQALPLAAGLDPAGGILASGSEQDRQNWIAVASGKPGPDFPAIFEQVIAAILEGRLKLDPATVPPEMRYLIGRALRVARPWPGRSSAGAGDQ